METKRGAALITGAGSGFGLYTAVELAKSGFRVFAGLRDPARSDALHGAACEAGATVEILELDVTRADAIASAVAETQRRAGGVEVLVNNAGFGMGGFLEDLTLDELRVQFETNFFGVVAMTKAVLPSMRERGRGRIINISSISGRLAPPGMSAYAASKWAVEGLSESLRHELKPLGIWVSLVEPGTYKTDIFGKNRRVAARATDPASPNYERSKRLEATVERMLARKRSSPIAVARTITRVALARRPKMRYLVGKDAYGEVAMKTLLPFSAIEWGVSQYLKR
jgi:NAD(P)-dependent dehydrogenase (short-subunit alcohol dehydrogenase family)